MSQAVEPCLHYFDRTRGCAKTRYKDLAPFEYEGVAKEACYDPIIPLHSYRYVTDSRAIYNYNEDQRIAAITSIRKQLYNWLKERNAFEGVMQECKVDIYNNVRLSMTLVDIYWPMGTKGTPCLQALDQMSTNAKKTGVKLRLENSHCTLLEWDLEVQKVTSQSVSRSM